MLAYLQVPLAKEEFQGSTDAQSADPWVTHLPVARRRTADLSAEGGLGEEGNQVPSSSTTGRNSAGGTLPTNHGLGEIFIKSKEQFK